MKRVQASFDNGVYYTYSAPLCFFLSINLQESILQASGSGGTDPLEPVE